VANRRLHATVVQIGSAWLAGHELDPRRGRATPQRLAAKVFARALLHILFAFAPWHLDCERPRVPARLPAPDETGRLRRIVAHAPIRRRGIGHEAELIRRKATGHRE